MNEYFRLAFFDAAGQFSHENAVTQDNNGNRIKDAKFKLFYEIFERYPEETLPLLETRGYSADCSSAGST